MKRSLNHIAAFRRAALRDDLDEMKRLLDDEPSLGKKENPESLPLIRLSKTIQFHMAILDGSLDRVRELLEQSPDLVGQRWTRQGFTPLSQAVVECHEGTFELLLEHGADPKETYDGGCSLLHTAAFSGWTMIAGRLLEMGFDVNLSNKSGHTPLRIAKDSGQTEMVGFLVDCGARE